MHLYSTYEPRKNLDSFSLSIIVRASQTGSRSPDYANFGHFASLFCRERQRNVLFGDVAVAIVVCLNSLLFPKGH